MSGNIPTGFWDNLKMFLKRKNELWRFGWLNAPNYLNIEQRYRDADDKDEFFDEVSSALKSDRDTIASVIDSSSGLEAFWKSIQRSISSPNAPGGVRMSDEFYQDLIVDMQTAAVVTIRSRGFTRGAPAYAGTGNGGILRRSTDRNSVAIEEGIASTVVLECMKDVSTGVQEGDEIFRIKTTGKVESPLDKSGGYDYEGDTITAVHALSTENILSNSDFSQYEAGVSPEFSNWSSEYWDMISQDTTTYYKINRGTRSRGDDTSELGVGYSCKMDPVDGADHAKIYQRLDSASGFDKNKPYALVVFHYGGVGADGNIKVSLGSQNSTVALAVGAWTVQSLLYFPSEFDSSPLDVVIERLADTAGDAYISNVFMVPMTKYNGEWYTIYAGSTNFLLDDAWTQAVTLVSKDVANPFVVEGKLQREIVKRTGDSPEKMNGRYLNHSATPTVDDWTQITGTATFVAPAAVTLNGVDTKYLSELKEDYYVYNATDDLPDDAVAINAPASDIAVNLKVAYGGTTGATKKIGVIIPWESFC